MKKLILAILMIANLALGQGWQNQTCPTITGLTTMRFLNSNTGIAGDSQGKIYRTTNGGTNWDSIAKPTSICLRNSFSVGNTVWIIGNDGNPNGSVAVFLRSTNMGTTWNTITTGISGIYLSLWMLNANTGFMGTTYQGLTKLRKTTNGGLNWTNSVNDPSLGVQLMFLDSLYGISNSGNIFITRDGGNTWNTIVYVALNKVFPVSKDIINNRDTLVGISPHKIYWNKYGGSNSWELIPCDTTMTYTDIHFINSRTGWVSGYDPGQYPPTSPFIKKTTNRGVTWLGQWDGLDSTNYMQYGVTAVNLYMLNSNTGWASAFNYNLMQFNNYRLLKTTTGGSITNIVGVPIVSKFSLSQNYPNPFNPFTKINFSIPKSSHVTLKVYDILGKEVDILVNEILNTGNYKVDWNASELPSGIYFYKLETEYIKDVKVMTLIK